MDVKDKASDITHTAISRVRQARLENAQEHNDHLRAKNDLLEDELKRTRSERERLADRYVALGLGQDVGAFVSWVQAHRDPADPGS